MKATYGLEIARAKLPHIAAEALAGQTSVITRHGEPIAAVVPIPLLKAQQAGRIRKDGVLALRGTGRDIWPMASGKFVGKLRDEWPD